MSMLRSYVNRDLLPSSPSVTDKQNLLLLPESLGGYFFGISSVIFFLTARDVYSKVSSTLQKSLTLVGLGIGFLLALLFHTQAAAELGLFSSTIYNREGVCVGAYIQASLEYRHGLLPTAAVIFIVSSWISGALLVWRAFVLSDRKRWVLSTFGSGLVAVIIPEVFFLAADSTEFAWLAYPIGNLVLSALIGIFVIYCHITRFKDQKETSPVVIVSDIIIDSGLILTVALILFLALTLAGVTTFFSQHIIFHIQNITSCTLISRIVDPAYSPGAVRLTGDDTNSE